MARLDLVLCGCMRVEAAMDNPCTGAGAGAWPWGGPSLNQGSCWHPHLANLRDGATACQLLPYPCQMLLPIPPARSLLPAPRPAHLAVCRQHDHGRVHLVRHLHTAPPHIRRRQRRVLTPVPACHGCALPVCRVRSRKLLPKPLPPPLVASPRTRPPHMLTFLTAPDRPPCPGLPCRFHPAPPRRPPPHHCGPSAAAVVNW